MEEKFSYTLKPAYLSLASRNDLPRNLPQPVIMQIVLMLSGCKWTAFFVSNC